MRFLIFFAGVLVSISFLALLGSKAIAQSSGEDDVDTINALSNAVVRDILDDNPKRIVFWGLALGRLSKTHRTHLAGSPGDDLISQGSTNSNEYSLEIYDANGLYATVTSLYVQASDSFTKFTVTIE